MSSSIHQAIHNSFVTLAQQYGYPVPDLHSEASIDAFAQALLQAPKKEMAQSCKQLTDKLRQIENEQAGKPGSASDADGDAQLVAKVKQISKQLTDCLAQSEPPVFLQKSASGVSCEELDPRTSWPPLTVLQELAEDLAEVGAGWPGRPNPFESFRRFQKAVPRRTLSKGDETQLRKLLQDFFKAYPSLENFALKDIVPCLIRLLAMSKDSRVDIPQNDGTQKKV